MVHKTYDLYKLFHQYIKLFPKTEKYSLGVKIENLILEILELTLFAVNSTAETRIKVLQKISLKVAILKILFRLTYEIKIIDDKKYICLQKELQEIGKMTGGWIRSLRH